MFDTYLIHVVNEEKRTLITQIAKTKAAYAVDTNGEWEGEPPSSEETTIHRYSVNTCACRKAYCLRTFKLQQHAVIAGMEIIYHLNNVDVKNRHPHQIVSGY